ncbi:MAG: hypothetical protein ACOXZS_00285 [Bacilli bacterium]
MAIIATRSELRTFLEIITVAGKMSILVSIFSFYAMLAPSSINPFGPTLGIFNKNFNNLRSKKRKKRIEAVSNILAQQKAKTINNVQQLEVCEAKLKKYETELNLLKEKRRQAKILFCGLKEEERRILSNVLRLHVQDNNIDTSIFDEAIAFVKKFNNNSLRTNLNDEIK